MTATPLKMISLLVIGILTGITPATRAVAQAVDREDEGKTLVGTWVVQVTRQDCQTHAPLGPPFLSLNTYNLGGTLTDSTSNPQFGPSQRGPGHGVWIHTGNHAYKALSAAFVIMPGTVGSVLASTQFVTQHIVVKTPDDYAVTATVEFIGPDGTTVLLTGCATAVGKRLEVQK